jgi:hypothetical protein
MSKERAIEICKNLTGTIDKMPDKRSILRHNELLNPNSIFDRASVKKSTLVNMKKKLITKYKLTKKELNE